MKFDSHKDYVFAQPYVKLVRDCIEGEPKVKSEMTTYLKHPNMLDQTSESQKNRYRAYIDGAEFDGFPAETETSMLGQMLSGDISVDLGGLDYLIEDSDGDGTSLTGAIEITFKNLLEVKFHVLLAEFQGLTGLDTADVTIEDVKRLNPRATIKHYSRESLIDWEFQRINGVMQLSLCVFVEEATERDADLTTACIKSYLVCALDENGDYYQQKYVESVNGTEKTIIEDGEPLYPLVSNKKLKWIPVEIVIDEETPSGKLPTGLGYLYPICSLALARYRVSADYKESLRFMQPTLFTSGWKSGDHELFKEINKRDYIAFGIGVSNNMPEGVTADVIGLGVEVEPYEKYFDHNEAKTRALGGKVDTGSGEKVITATQSAIDHARNSAAMTKIVRNTEAAFKRVIAYCAMFHGLVAADSVETYINQITLDLPLDFGVKMTPEEVLATISAVQSSIISKEEGLRKLTQGGFTVGSADDIITELENQQPIVGNTSTLV